MTAKASVRDGRIFDRFTESPDWRGFGYLGGRNNALDSTDPECSAQPELVAATDRRILEHTASWTDADLFKWANSRDGRHLADAVFSGDEVSADRAFGEWNLLRKIKG